MLKTYPQHVTQKEIGKSFEGRSLYSYKLHSLIDESKPTTKSIVLFTGVHHARELLTANMIVKIFVETLHNLLYQTSQHTFWHFCDLLIVPLVNIDGHAFISKAYGTQSWASNKDKRKNMNSNYCPTSDVNEGVDLNRNYGFHYGESSEDVD